MSTQQWIQKTARTTRVFLTKNSPTILTGVSVAGLVSTSVMAVRATPKALHLLEMEKSHRVSKNKPKMTKLDTVKCTWKCYIPAVIMGTVTITCIVSANSINLKRSAALASAYSLAETTLKEYKSKVVETIGEKKEKEIKDEIVKDKIVKDPPHADNVILTGKGTTLCRETLSGRYFRTNIDDLRKIENELARDLLSDDFISVNDVYYRLGLSNTKLGDEMGWEQRDGLFSFELNSQVTEEGEPCLTIDYFAPPSASFMDFH